jgi:hypothetical protein
MGGDTQLISVYYPSIYIRQEKLCTCQKSNTNTPPPKPEDLHSVFSVCDILLCVSSNTDYQKTNCSVNLHKFTHILLQSQDDTFHLIMLGHLQVDYT